MENGAKADKSSEAYDRNDFNKKQFGILMIMIFIMGITFPL